MISKNNMCLNYPINNSCIVNGVNKQLSEQLRLSNIGVPYCWHCWEELQLNENNDIYCPNCGLVIEVKE